MFLKLRDYTINFYYLNLLRLFSEKLLEMYEKNVNFIKQIGNLKKV